MEKTKAVLSIASHHSSVLCLVSLLSSTPFYDLAAAMPPQKSHPGGIIEQFTSRTEPPPKLPTCPASIAVLAFRPVTDGGGRSGVKVVPASLFETWYVQVAGENFDNISQPVASALSSSRRFS